MDEQQAVARLQQGDIAGLEYLVRRYQAAALEAAFLVSRDAALAEDLVQAAFLRAYERIHQFDPGRPFGPWFLRGVVNDALKAVSRGRQVPLDAVAPRLPQPISPDPGPEEMLAAAETQEAVWAAIDQLSPAQRAAVVLRYYLDLSDAEIAGHLAVPPGTVRRRLHDARQRLRRLLPAWVRAPAGDGR
jgi:RNA polymerase sigma-70 factor (ECF subfamily)